MGKYRELGTSLDRVFRNNLNDNFNDIDADITAVNGRINNIVASAGNDNTEIVDARGGAPVLGERLDGLDAQLAENADKVANNTLGLPPAALKGVTVTNSYTGVLPLTFHDGWLYGFKNNTTIVKSNDDGTTWQDVTTAPYGSVHSILWTNDGEVLITNSAYISKSSGWSINPATATWTNKVSKSMSTGVGILPWGIDGNGQKFIATEYSGADRSESRYVWISTDAGNTWNIVVDKYSLDPTHTSHMHGVCYDKWADRFFLSHGHGILRGVYYSDDDGLTWNKIGGAFQPDAAPTTLYATDNGIVCGSDSGDAGLYGIVRTENPANMEMRRTARWNVEEQGVTGFSYRSVRDEKTGHVYVSFKSDLSNVASVIMAGTATAGSTVWESPTKGATKFLYMALSNEKILGVIDRSGVLELVKGEISQTSVETFDNGNIMNGIADNSTSIAIGKNVKVSSANEVVIGRNATLGEATTKTGNVVVGNSARGTARSVAVGNNAQNLDGSYDSVAIGNASKVAGVDAIAIGNSANVPSGQTGAVAIGKTTEAYVGGVAVGTGAKTGTSTTNGVAVGSSSYAGSSAVGIGRLASAGTQQVAIGLSAIANHLNSIALGANVSTTATDQLNIGARHIEVKKVTEPANTPADTGRLFLKDNGSGKMQLCVKLGTETIILATQT